MSFGGSHPTLLGFSEFHPHPPPKPRDTTIPGRGKPSHLMHPVFAFGVPHALVKGVARKQHHEVPGAHHALNELVLKLPGLQLLHVDEDAESVQLQVDLQEAGEAGRGQGVCVKGRGGLTQAPIIGLFPIASPERFRVMA